MPHLIKKISNYKKKNNFSMVEVKDIEYGLKVKDLIEFLQNCNPDAIVLNKYDGCTYSLSLPKKVLLEEVWDGDKYTGPSYSIKYDDNDYNEIEVNDGTETAIKFE